MAELRCDTPDDTYAAGRRLGLAARPGTVVALIGDLGAGKTLFSRGVGEGLAVTTRMQSPTFVLVQGHTGGRLPLWHADLYRLGEVDEIEQIGLDELLEGDGVVLVEWADRFPELLPADHLEIRLEETGPEKRVLRIAASGPHHQPLEQAVVG